MLGIKTHIQPLSGPRWKPYAGRVAWLQLRGSSFQTQLFWQDVQELLHDMHALDLLLCMSLYLQLIPPVAYKLQRYPQPKGSRIVRYPQPTGSRIVWTTGTASPRWYSCRITAFALLWSLLPAMFSFLDNYKLFLGDKQALPIQSYSNNHHSSCGSCRFSQAETKGNARSEKPAGTEYLDVLPCLYCMANYSFDMDPTFLRN